MALGLDNKGFSDALVWWPLIGWLAASAVIVGLVSRRRSAAALAVRT